MSESAIPPKDDKSPGQEGERHTLPPSHEFSVPKREIFNMIDMPKWDKSQAYFEYIGFVTALSEEIKGKPNNGNYSKTPVIDKLCILLETLDKWIDEIPPLEQPQRFGNKAFRTWHSRLVEQSGSLLKDVLNEDLHGSIVELELYLTDSFGNSTRIDYGTGHEMAFVMFLLCLFKVGALYTSDKESAVLIVFNRYLELVRKLQTVYKMEPAGSRGVWALDDYQFIPFIWGSSQLNGHPRLQPSSFIKEDIVQMFAKDYMFLRCIQFISQVKTGPFAEHSNQLWNISGVPTWQKVNAGLIKMYKAEVLSKFPVVQHVLFGSLLSIAPVPAEQAKPHPSEPFKRPQ